MWEKDRFTEQLQGDQAVQDAGIEVLNLGVNSYNFRHYLELARLHFMDLEPDMVVVGFTLNDIQKIDRVWPNKRVKPPDGHGEAGERKKWYEKPLWVVRIQKSLGRTYAGRFVRYSGEVISFSMMSEEKLRDYNTKWMRSAVKYWSKDLNGEKLRGEMREFQEEMSRQGIPFAFLIFPERNDLLNPGEYSLPRESIKNMLKELDLGYCDAYDVFAAMPDINSLYLPNDSVHFTPMGHSVIKDVLLACSEDDTIPFFPATEHED